MLRYGQHGYAAKHLDLTSSQREAARSALRVQLSVMFSAAGALGMPFIGSILAVLEQSTDWELNKNIREGLNNAFGEDNEMGNYFADVALDGFANKLAGGTGIPADFGSRFAMGGIIGTDAHRGFSSSALFGPTASIAKNVLKGASALKDAKFGQAFEDVAPVPWKKVINIVRNEGEIIDRFGNKIVETDNLSKSSFPFQQSYVQHYHHLLQRKLLCQIYLRYSWLF